MRAKKATAAAIRATARALGLGLAVAVEGDAVQLHAMVDEAEAKLLRDPLLQCFEFVIDGDKLECHLTGVYRDRVVIQDGQWKIQHRDAAMDVPYNPGDVNLPPR